MNTVEALKNLYKTMSGKDWPYDPNPTDAEVIDKIAADGNAGGSGGGVIFIEHKTGSEGSWYEGTTIDPGLGVEDLLKYTWCSIMPITTDCWAPFMPAIPIQQSSEDTIKVFVSVIEGEQNVEVPVFYHKDTGVIKSLVSD